MRGGAGEDTKKCQGGDGKNGRELGIRTQFSRDGPEGSPAASW